MAGKTKKLKNQTQTQTQKQLWVCNFRVDSCSVQTCQTKNHEKKITFKLKRKRRQNTKNRQSLRDTTMPGIYIIENHKPEINRCRKKTYRPHWHGKADEMFLKSGKSQHVETIKSTVFKNVVRDRGKKKDGKAKKGRYCNRQRSMYYSYFCVFFLFIFFSGYISSIYFVGLVFPFQFEPHLVNMCVDRWEWQRRWRHHKLRCANNQQNCTWA